LDTILSFAITVNIKNPPCSLSPPVHSGIRPLLVLHQFSSLSSLLSQEISCRPHRDSQQPLHNKHPCMHTACSLSLTVRRPPFSSPHPLDRRPRCWIKQRITSVSEPQTTTLTTPVEAEKSYHPIARNHPMESRLRGNLTGTIATFPRLYTCICAQHIRVPCGT
jgi:hypothetical protein